MPPQLVSSRPPFVTTVRQTATVSASAADVSFFERRRRSYRQRRAAAAAAKPPSPPQPRKRPSYPNQRPGTKTRPLPPVADAPVAKASLGKAFAEDKPKMTDEVEC